MQFLHDYNIPPLDQPPAPAYDGERAAPKIGSPAASSIASLLGRGIGPSSPSSTASSSSELLTLIEERRWPELRKFVRQRDAAQQFSLFSKPTPRGEGEVRDAGVDGNALHLLCACRPPRDVVELFLRRSPEDASGTDSRLRTPLHVAVDCAAGPDVVAALLRGCPPSSRARDGLGKTPLVHACESAGGDRRSNRVIRALIEADPLSVLEEDDAERTALEHAINAGAPDKVVRALQGTAIRAAMMTDADARRRRRRREVGRQTAASSA